MIAILSMTVASLFTFNQHKNALVLRMDMISRDMELRSTNVAASLMEEIGAMAYDDATKSGSISNSSELTFVQPSEEQNEGGATTEAGGTDDLDDYDGTTLNRTRMRNGKTMTFSATTDVEYTTETGHSTDGAPSKFKRVTVSVSSTDVAIADTIRISRIFACGARCVW
ncbi:MAG: hypothetical protein HKN43_08715 [Rhodothermales bacterium]|nr:hypothetical protein [Rhodothermales bacterium]